MSKPHERSATKAIANLGTTAPPRRVRARRDFRFVADVAAKTSLLLPQLSSVVAGDSETVGHKTRSHCLGPPVPYGPAEVHRNVGPSGPVGITGVKPGL